MAITDPFILPKDVVLVPVSDLSAEVREQFQSAESDYAITRPRSRTPSKIVDAETAKLLMEFRASKTIVEAVISYSEASQLNPEETLDEAFPILQRFINARILVPPESDDAHRITACFELGDKIAAFEVLRCIQVLEDTELYQVKTSAGA